MERYVGLDLSRKRLDWHLVDGQARTLAVGAVSPQPHGLAQLVVEVGPAAVAVIESMNGARFVHDQLELAGWEVRIADAQRVKDAVRTGDGLQRAYGAARVVDDREGVEQERSEEQVALVGRLDDNPTTAVAHDGRSCCPPPLSSKAPSA